MIKNIWVNEHCEAAQLVARAICYHATAAWTQINETYSEDEFVVFYSDDEYCILDANTFDIEELTRKM